MAPLSQLSIPYFPVSLQFWVLGCVVLYAARIDDTVLVISNRLFALCNKFGWSGKSTVSRSTSRV